MHDCLYLIALALIEQDGCRAMPLCGKSVKLSNDSGDDFCNLRESLISQILLTVFQRSEKGPLRRAADDSSLLLIQISIEEMQENLPSLKADWIRTGNTEELIVSLKKICKGLWDASFTKEDGIQINLIE
ncbi:hypothetical protein [Prochlorococcus sp. MIT 1341]|uniref:hypothetical protein n=1 Tax=Prochlorococcus sp. MIT 1341 TaxID=3096221 RepID=UPI002A75C18E|nr:hypothetical protein [Prochlorococcus sp. MIT 1341]